MRVRITKRPRDNYGLDDSSLRIGRVYNLASELASALLADGCAELYETLPAEQRARTTGRELWQALDRHDRSQKTGVPSSNKPE